MERKDYTVIVYKQDRRAKSGERMVLKKDHTDIDLQTLRHIYLTTWFIKDGYRHEFHETYTEVANLITGKTVKERFDTPSCCSVGSEAYWSM
jgi:hypothetical protein